MQRRTYIKSAFAIAGVISIAGCSSQYNQNLSQAEESLRKALQELQKEADKFNSADLSSGNVDVETEAIENHLDTAEESVNAAASNADEGQQEEIQSFRTYITFARSLTAYLDLLVEGLNNTINGNEKFQAEQYDAAAKQLNTAEEKLSNASDELRETQNAWSDLKQSDIDIENVEEFDESLTGLESLNSFFLPFAAGVGELSEGFIDFTAGESAYDSENYTVAQDKFNQASTHFDSAHSTLQSSQEDIPEEQDISVSELICIADSLRDTSNHLDNAAEASENGNNNRAREEAQKANADANRCS